MEKILAVKDAIYAVAERRPDKNEKFRLAGMRYRCSALTNTYYIAIGRYPISHVYFVYSAVYLLYLRTFTVYVFRSLSVKYGRLCI